MRAHHFVALLATVVSFAATFEKASADDRPRVDALVVLATDVSDSVEERDYPGPGEYTLQKRGIVQALRDPRVTMVLEQCNSLGIGINYVEWSGTPQQKQTVERVSWRHIKTGADLQNFANEIAAIQDRAFQDGTDIISALDFSARSIELAPMQSDRKIIDISSDGKQTVADASIYRMSPGAPQLSRDLKALSADLEKRGFTINALVIENDGAYKGPVYPLHKYFQDHVQAGPGSFVIPVKSFDDYADGLARKLMRELDHCMM